MLRSVIVVHFVFFAFVFLDDLADAAQIIFGQNPMVASPFLCIERENEIVESSVVLGLCDYAGSASTSNNEKVIFSYGADGFLRNPLSSTCIR